AARNRVFLRRPNDSFGLAGMAVFALAVIGYPLLAILFGRPWTQAAGVGIAPDPTVLAPRGGLSAATRPHRQLLAPPLLWRAYSGATLWTMESPDAALLPAAAALAIVLTAWKARSQVT